MAAEPLAHLDTGGDDHVVGTRHDALRGEVRCLLGGTALAVDGGTDDGLREPGRQRGVAVVHGGDVVALHEDAGHRLARVEDGLVDEVEEARLPASPGGRDLKRWCTQ